MKSAHPGPSPLLAFLLTVTVAMCFALYTNHVWEDYYITYRSSKNLATGHGLVFNPGDRLHTFTSPLGVLLPCVAYGLTGLKSDPAALWIFRGMCALALGGAAALLVSFARKLGYPGLAVFALVAFPVTDAKTLDFTTNGMETAFMLLFLTYAVWSHLRPRARQWLHLGAAWGGLMWTRPDSFIYITLIATGFWLFNDEKISGRNRWQLLRLYCQAAMVTTALYLPWLLWAKWYYGTPVPHTITAKSGIGEPHSLRGLLLALVQLPWHGWKGSGSLELTYLPSYYMIGGWPSPLILASRCIAIATSLLWLLPRLRLETRAAAFAFFGAHVYLSYFPYFPFPWYIPSTALLAAVAWSGVLAQLLASTRATWVRYLAALIFAGFAATSAWTSCQVARQVAGQQRFVEEGNRRQIGEWLRQNAQPTDTIFMEPLGYIGFYSGLKTFDFPGMSSREMVRARQQVGLEWSALIRYLQPTWVLLRPFELRKVRAAESGFEEQYVVERNFDVSAGVSALPVYGRPYLEVDSRFILFRRITDNSLSVEVEGISSLYPTSKLTLNNVALTLIHAPGKMVVRVPAATSLLRIHYGFPPGAYEGENPTDGAIFQVIWQTENHSILLLTRKLDPATNPSHRPIQYLETKLPSIEVGEHAVLTFRTTPGGGTAKDWTLWSEPEIR